MGNTDVKRFTSVFPTVILSSKARRHYIMIWALFCEGVTTMYRMVIEESRWEGVSPGAGLSLLTDRGHVLVWIQRSLVGHFFSSRSQRTKGKGPRRRHGTHAENDGGQTRADHRCGSASLRARCGFARATNSEIAREAGNMTPGLIYYYFKSKEDLRKRGSAGAFTAAGLDADPSRDAGVAARCAFAAGCRASPGSDGR